MGIAIGIIRHSPLCYNLEENAKQKQGTQHSTKVKKSELYQWIYQT